VLRRALALGFLRIEFLKGGLAAWKAKGYPVEPYKGSFTSTQAWSRALSDLGGATGSCSSLLLSLAKAAYC
jgi:hypothetical protein